MTIETINFKFKTKIVEMIKVQQLKQFLWLFATSILIKEAKKNQKKTWKYIHNQKRL